MRPDFAHRVGDGLALLEFCICADSGKVYVGYARKLDYYLELVVWLGLSFPLLLMAAGLINPLLSGNWPDRLLYGCLLLMAMAGAVAMLHQVLMLARDGFRRVCFDPENGDIKIDRGGFDHLVLRYITLHSSDVAGLRLNRFVCNAFLGMKRIDGYEIVLVMRDGNMHVVFPLLPSLEKARETVTQLSEATRINVIG